MLRVMVCAWADLDQAQPKYGATLEQPFSLDIHEVPSKTPDPRNHTLPPQRTGTHPAGMRRGTQDALLQAVEMCQRPTISAIYCARSLSAESHSSEATVVLEQRSDIFCLLSPPAGGAISSIAKNPGMLVDFLLDCCLSPCLVCSAEHQPLAIATISELLAQLGQPFCHA